MTGKSERLQNIPADRALKLNVKGAGNYRVEYDEPSWNSLLRTLPQMGVEDRVNLLSDAWALVQANRASVSDYFGLVDKIPSSTELAEREQIINVLDFINRLLIGHPEREKFQAYARSILRPTFDALGWDLKDGEPATAGNLRASLINALGDLNDQEIVASCRERFKKYLSNHNRSNPIFVRQFLRSSAVTPTKQLGTSFTSSV